MSNNAVSTGRLVARNVAPVYLGLAVGMAGCGVLGWVFEQTTLEARPIDEGSLRDLLLCAIAVTVVALGCWVWGRPAHGALLNRKSATVVVSAIWFGAAALGALPYLLSGGLDPAAALFESISGFTTTGSTVVADIEGTLPHGLLLWRSLTQWLGGMGIVVLFVALIPNLGAGGKHMFRSEIPGHDAQGLVPRVGATSAFLWRLYLAFTLAEVAVLSLLGMGLFDAVNHSFTTMATGGFSTYDDSIGAFDSPAIELAISFFMLAGGVNFGLYFLVLRGGGFAKALKNLELRVYLGLVVVVTMFMAISTLPMRDGAWLVSLQKSLFKVISVLTSTGYSVESDVLYGQPVVLALVMLMFIGGSSGSTSGGLKVSRIMIVVETAWITVRQHVRPNVVEVVKLDGQVVDERKVREVSTVLFVHGASLLIGAFVIALIEGTSGPTSLGAMLTCLSNMGPAPFHVGADNFASYGPLAHLIFGFAMILGRLEFLTVMVLLLPEMWRR